MFIYHNIAPIIPANIGIGIYQYFIRLSTTPENHIVIPGNFVDVPNLSNTSCIIGIITNVPTNNNNKVLKLI